MMNVIYISHDLAYDAANAVFIRRILDSVQDSKLVVFDNDYHYLHGKDYAAAIGISEHDIANVLWLIPEEDDQDDRMAERVNKHFQQRRVRDSIGRFVILDIHNYRMSKMFPNNVIDCEKQLTESAAKEAVWILTGFGKDKKMTANTWFISDTHFNHGNIIKYCNRPWYSGVDESTGEYKITLEDVANMNLAMIHRWNKIVRKDDIVWHLGDFALGDKSQIPKIVSQLNGRINLVLGNHDHHKIKFYYDAGFHRVYDRPVIINQHVILSHAPLEFVKGPFFNVFGHVHDSATYQTWSKDSCCVCVERHDYAPVSWTEIEKHYRELNHD